MVTCSDPMHPPASVPEPHFQQSMLKRIVRAAKGGFEGKTPRQMTSASTTAQTRSSRQSYTQHAKPQTRFWECLVFTCRRYSDDGSTSYHSCCDGDGASCIVQCTGFGLYYDCTIWQALTSVAHERYRRNCFLNAWLNTSSAQHTVLMK